MVETAARRAPVGSVELILARISLHLWIDSEGRRSRDGPKELYHLMWKIGDPKRNHAGSPDFVAFLSYSSYKNYKHIGLLTGAVASSIMIH